jgi:hypothetical protein
VQRAGLAPLAVLLAALLAVLSVGGIVRAAPAPDLAAPQPAASPDAAVTWPPSTTLLLSEVETGGASASDEFVEITNAGVLVVDLVGLEIAYVTSSGGTVTRKASWPESQLLEPGRHLLLANASGTFAAIADATYSGGFAATGGALVLRPIGGTAIDALAWGDATNAFVEGTAAPAPAAGSSLERLPGSQGGNTIDTNVNADDWFAQALPNPQNLAAAPTPAPAPSMTPGPTDSPLPSDSPLTSPTPGPTDSPLPSDSPLASPTPGPTDSPLPSASPLPPPTPSPTTAATPVPSASPDPVVAIADARLLPDGASARVLGVLTTALGALDDGRKGFVQDASGGIAVYLDASPDVLLAAGTVIETVGTVDDRYAERTLRTTLAGVTVLGVAALPASQAVSTGSIDEAVEGQRVTVEGLTVGTPSAMADGLGILVDDGSGSIRAVIATAALDGLTLPAGTTVVVTGPVGQHDSTGTGATAYRIHATLAGELVVLPEPLPSPPASPAPPPSPAPSPSPTLTPPPTPAPTASPIPDATPVVVIRTAAIGTVVTVAGVVTAEAGRLGTPPLIAIADATAGIVVRVPDGIAPPGRGTALLVTGKLADPYGQLEVRPEPVGFTVTGIGPLPEPLVVTAADLGEASEGRLVQITGSTSSSPTRSTSGDLSIELVDELGRSFRALVDGSSGVAAGDVPLDRTLRLTGIVGQRASRKGALDGYRIWIRDRADIVVVPGSAAGGATAGAGSASGVVSVAAALAAPDGAELTIEAVETAGAALLDSTGRRIVVQDPTGAIEILLPAGASDPGVGSRLRVVGDKAHAWGAPRLRASSVTRVGSGPAPAPAVRSKALGSRDEWRLVRLSGTLVDVARTGDRWRAELRLASGERVPVLGQAGAGIPSTAISEGRSATVVGIVRRPYPTATDRRFALLPRGRADVTIAPLGFHGPGGLDAAGISGTGREGAATRSEASAITPDTDLATLSEHLGEVVRVGGLVTAVMGDGLRLDDGTAVARLVLDGDATVLLPHIRPGDALAARGIVRRAGEELEIEVATAADLVRVGALGEALPVAPTRSPVPLAGPAAGPAASPIGGPAHAGDWLAIAGLTEGLPAEVSVATLTTVTVLSLLVTWLRRRAAAQRSRALVLARLATLGGDGRPEPPPDRG